MLNKQIKQAWQYGQELKEEREQRGDLYYWKKVLRLIEEDFLYLCYILGHADVGNPFHFGFMNWLKRFERGGKNKGLALFPRGHLKTTMLQAYIIRQIIRRKGNVRVGITSWNLDVVTAMSASIKNICEYNQVLKNGFPGIFWEFIGPSAAPWRADAFRLKGLEKHVREATVEAFDINDPPTSRHYDIIIYDDIVGISSTRDAKARAELKNMYGFTVPLLEPGGTQLMVGTPYHFHDFYADVISGRVVGDWDVVVKPMTNEDGSLLWPERFVHTKSEAREKVIAMQALGIDSPKIISVEELKELPASIYYSQYELKALPPDDLVFKQEHICYEEPPEFGLSGYVVGIDPAKTTKEYSANTAIVIISVYSEKKMFVEEVINAKIETVEIIDLIMRYNKMFPDALFAIETTGWNDIYRLIKEEASRREENIDLDEVKPKDSKIDRVRNVLEFPMKKGNIKFRRRIENSPGAQDLIKQILEFPQCAYWDAIDALVHAVSKSENPGIIKKEEEKTYNRLTERLEKYEHSIERSTIWS